MPFSFTLRVPLAVFASLMYFLTASALPVPHVPRFPIICHSPSGRCAGVSPRSHDVTLPRNMWDGKDSRAITGAHVPLATFKTNPTPVQDQPTRGLISPCKGSHVTEQTASHKISSSGANAPTQPAHRPVIVFLTKTDKFSIPVYKSA